MAEEEALTDLFSHPDDTMSCPPASTFHPFTRTNLERYPEKKELRIQLVGTHVLWSHCLWNAGVAFARYIEAFPEVVKDKQILELGAGAGLPSLVSTFLGASLVSVVPCRRTLY